MGFAPLQALYARIDAGMERRGWGNQKKELVWHYLRCLWENVLAVVPISALLWISMGAFFGVAPTRVVGQVLGLLAAIVGLVFFVDGLRVCVMPLAELVGKELPHKVPLPVVLLVAGILGVLVTYAEPAIASLQPLADLVDPVKAPYLYYMMNQKRELMVLSIGLGVGVAAVIGTLRFVRGWSLKPIIVLLIVPVVGLSCYMHWGNPDLQPLIGLAWDCGAVTTGPVTVPILLALGIGVMSGQRQKKLAAMALEKAVTANEGQALEGFGIVTLASLLPVLAVQLMGVLLTMEISKEEIVEQALRAHGDRQRSVLALSPVKEIFFAFRAITPLIAAMLLLVLVVLWRPLPNLTIFTVPPDEKEAEEEERRKQKTGAAAAAGNGTSDAASLLPLAAAVGRSDAPAAATAAAADVESAAKSTSTATDHPAPLPSLDPSRHKYLCIGAAMALGGMILFNLGLTYGFTALGDQAGTLLPGAYKQLYVTPADQPGVQLLVAGTPYYAAGTGIVLVLLIVFSLGFLATRAEPALNVLGRTVQHLSKGSFSAHLLIYAVCVGVGTGMAAGSSKILFGVPLIYWILGKYAIALTLTYFSTEDYTNIAWDSAGVTTGPVTVPFVLSLGIGFSKAVHATEGFGILTCASVAPIISVLTVNMLRLPAMRAASAAREGIGRAADKLGASSLGRASASIARSSVQFTRSLRLGGLRRSGGAGDADASLARASVATVLAGYTRYEQSLQDGGSRPELAAQSVMMSASVGYRSSVAEAAPGATLPPPPSDHTPLETRTRRGVGRASVSFADGYSWRSSTGAEDGGRAAGGEGLLLGRPMRLSAAAAEGSDAEEDDGSNVHFPVRPSGPGVLAVAAAANREAAAAATAQGGAPPPHLAAAAGAAAASAGGESAPAAAGSSALLQRSTERSDAPSSGWS